MTYVDSSVWMAAMFEEENTNSAHQILQSGGIFLSSWLTRVEVGRNIARLNRLRISHIARQNILRRFNGLPIIAIDESDWDLAVEIAESTMVKTLDSLQLAVVRNLGLRNPSFATFDKRQANAARAMGFSVVGA